MSRSSSASVSAPRVVDRHRAWLDVPIRTGEASGTAIARAAYETIVIVPRMPAS